MNRKCLAGAVTATAAVMAYRVGVRPWHERWGATDAEVRADLNGDDLVAEPAEQCTRGITIDAPRDEVWRWVIQLGADRGGFYSYDWLENLFGLGIHSAHRVVPEWQHRSVGDLVYAEASGTAGWYVMEVRPNDVLVLEVADVKEGRPTTRRGPMGWEFVWTFALRDGPNGTTRLLVRERLGYGSALMKLAMGPVGLVSFVMSRRMMLTIKARAEEATLR